MLFVGADTEGLVRLATTADGIETLYWDIKFSTSVDGRWTRRRFPQAGRR